ncbi:NAD(P)-dependent alcohol dehydrogenase [Isoptericola jiangsuensis]|uniref:NAD(P)-dependent alcohol dehydrogenase n=1 Tax=Isoptericola jiangsuensis TaxID=548579 RepID=UPI003AAEE0BD
MRALRLQAWQQEPELVDVPEPTPGPGQVVVKVGASGACHSDLHLMHDFTEGAVPWNPPFTLGHENAGTVHAVGEGVSSVAEGDRVVLYGPWGCGVCSMCTRGFETYCENPAGAPIPGGGGGLGLDGGMADYLLVPHERFCLPLPDGVDMTAGAALTDAGLTPYHAVRRSWSKMTPDATVAVIGVGGLGHMAVQIVKATTAARVVALDVKQEALDLAREHGADEVLVSDEHAAEALRDLTGGRGVDVALDFVGATPTLETARKSTRSTGEATLVGLAGAEVPFSVSSQAYEVSMASTYWGGRHELAELMSLAARGAVTVEHTTYSLDDALQAYHDLADGKVRGRAVIVP